MTHQSFMFCERFSFLMSHDKPWGIVMTYHGLWVVIMSFMTSFATKRHCQGDLVLQERHFAIGWISLSIMHLT